MKRSILLSAVFVTSYAFSVPALADDLPQGAPARAMFDAAKKFWADEHFERACEKFAESQRLEPRAATLYNLGACYAKIGKVASAYSCYSRAEEEYKKKGNQVSAIEAQEQGEALISRIPKMTINVPAAVARLEGVIVRRNGDIVRRAQWGIPIFVDPGNVVVEVTAPGHIPSRSATTIEEGKTGSVAVSIPVVLPMPTQKKIALGVGGVGLAGGIVGAVFGSLAMSQWQAVEQYCGPAIPTCGQGLYFDHANEMRANANQSATISTVAFGVGIAALGTAIAIWAKSPPSN